TEFLNVAKNPNDKVVGRKNSDGKDFVSDDYYRFFFERCMGFAESSANSNPYFDYAREGESVLLHSKPVLNSEFQAKVDSNDEEALTKLLKYFFNTDLADQTGLYFDAIKDMKGPLYNKVSVQTYYQEQATRYSMAAWGSQAITVMPIVLILFLIIPLCRKDGESLGKLIFGIKVVSAEGFRINKLQRIFRPLLVTLLHLAALIPNVGIGLAIYFVGAIVSFLMMALGKKRMNIHERITRTIVVDKKYSIIFSSLHDKSLYMEKHNVDEKGNPLIKVSEVEGEPTVNLTKEE
ncbi:MAG: RDD family protein, partial [Bacilli bacterium]|nr:RDD family protein [Bacilli bacterium]